MNIKNFLFANAILLRIAKATLLAEVTIGKQADCSIYTLENLAGLESQVFFCLDNKTIMIHADKLTIPHDQLGLRKDEKWIQLAVGDVQTTKSRQPLASCASGAHGSGILKSSLNLDTRAITINGSFKFKLTVWLQLSMTISSHLLAALENQNEYVCLAREGQMVQIIKYHLKYTFSGWSFRSVLAEQPFFSDWIDIPRFSITDLMEQVECITDESQLECTEI